MNVLQGMQPASQNDASVCRNVTLDTWLLSSASVDVSVTLVDRERPHNVHSTPLRQFMVEDRVWARTERELNLEFEMSVLSFQCILILFP
jgi:hypothetical protein